MATAGAAANGLPVSVDEATQFAREDPLLAAGIVVGTLVFLIVLWFVVRRLLRTKGGVFLRTLGKRDEVAVLMHPNPDPDAMACALGVAELADAAGTETTLQYPGQIRHQENRAFETVLDLNFDRVESAADVACESVVLVDHNEPRGFSGAEQIEPYAVVDHHPGEGEGSAFTDVRTEYGSCASILSEYFRDLGWDPVGPEEEPDNGNDDDAGWEAVDPDPEDEDDEETGWESRSDEKILPSPVSTALLYGIQSDTKHLTKGCSGAEFEASAYLYRGIDEDRLDRIANPQVDAEVLDVKARAISEREVRNAFAVSDVGDISNADAVPQAADELMRLEGVTAVVVMGCKDDTLHLSGRSRDDRVHMGKTLRAAVEDIPQGSAGGHARMGGGQLSLEHMDGIGPSTGVSRTEFTDTLFDAMAGEV